MYDYENKQNYILFSHVKINMRLQRLMQLWFIGFPDKKSVGVLQVQESVWDYL